MSNETKQKLILANKGKSSWVKYVPKEKTPMFGKHQSEETKRKIGNANRGRVISQIGRERMRIAKLGKKRPPHSEETKAKISHSHLGIGCIYKGKHVNHPNSIPVIQYDIQGNKLNEFESIGEAERITGVKQISRSIKINIKAGGFIWKKKILN